MKQFVSITAIRSANAAMKAWAPSQAMPPAHRPPECDEPADDYEAGIHTEPGDLEDTKRETESAALFVAGLVIVCICACLGLWLSFVVGGS